MPSTATDTTPHLAIAEVAEATGLSQHTLRWYEREGLCPRVERGTDRRRRYHPRQVQLLRLLVRLRRTGMPTREMREFSRMVSEGAATHGRRLALLATHRERIVARIDELQADLVALDEKTEHYRALIDQGLDCDGAAVDTETAIRQKSSAV